MSKIGIFIPCYNVENSVPKVLACFPPEVLSCIDEVVVADNASQDNTLKILKDAQANGSAVGRKLVIIKNNENYGLGGTQKIAYQYFLDHGFSHFMIIHGDNQGDARQISQSFLKTLNEDADVDVVIASRFRKGSDTSQYNSLRMIGNLVFNFLTFALTGHQMTDSGAAIMLVRTDILKDMPFRHLTNSFQFNPQLNILYYNRKNLKIKEVPMKWRDSDDKSNITALNYCLTLLRILLRYRINKSVLRKSGWQLFHSQSQEINPSFEVIKP